MLVEINRHLNQAGSFGENKVRRDLNTHPFSFYI